MTDQLKPCPAFTGFQDFRANVTFIPIQFFTVVLPHSSRGTARIVGYALRRLLGWVDEHGNPTREQLRLTYRELIDGAGVSRGAIGQALKEAVAGRFLRRARLPSPHHSGQPAQSAIYELCWDATGGYTDDPAAFQGFYYPEAAMLPVREGETVVHRPKAARKNIPNAFFDTLLPREPLSVIRLVAALLFYSIQWGPGGERKVPVSRSITDLSRLTNLSRQHVHEAVQTAVREGYIERVDRGRFDPAAGLDSAAATYGIRWVKGIPNGQFLDQRFKKVDGASVQKGEREQFKKVNGERSKKVNDISIKTEPKTDQTATPPPTVPEAAAVNAGQELLRRAGFDQKAACQLAAKSPLEVIQRQVEWLPLRHTTRNRLGLLRRAIEEDWPKPEGAIADPGLLSGRSFARYYYAAYHGYTGQPGTELFPKDVEGAAKFLSRMPAPLPDDFLAREWGRRFGTFIRAKHRNERGAKPNLSFALVLYGDEFLSTIQGPRATQDERALVRAREARHQALQPAYLAYLRLAEENAQRATPGLYAAFAEERRRTRSVMTGGLFVASPETLARFDQEASRLFAFAEFFRNRAENPVLDFAHWDDRQNLPSKPTPATSQDNWFVRFPAPAATEAGERVAVIGVPEPPAASGTILE